MIYYHCEDCGEMFSEEAAGTKSIYDGYGELDYYACPSCGSTAIAECGVCRICGAPIEPGEDYCPDCKWETRKIWNRAVEEVMCRCDDADSVEAERRFIEYLEDGLGVI